MALYEVEWDAFGVAFVGADSQEEAEDAVADAFMNWSGATGWDGNQTGGVSVRAERAEHDD